MSRTRAVIITAAAALLVIPLLREPSRPVRAARETDPNSLWSIGTPDNSADEFAAGAPRNLIYTVGRSTPARDWRQRQDSAEESPSVYHIRFRVDAPAASLLAVDGFFIGIAPRALIVDANGKRGFFRIQPAGGPDLDERQANVITHAQQSFRIPIDAALLRAGDNDLGLAFLGDGGSFYYDALSLRRSETQAPALEARLEPTIFFRRAGDQLREVVQVVLAHRTPLGGDAAVSLKLGSAPPIRKQVPAPYDFGEEVAEIEVPAPASAVPYELRVTSGGSTLSFPGTFQPEKRWRIFAGLKIHNDIGFTDLQPHVQELDNRNTDGALDIIARFPFYKFNFETGWLAENYLHSRSAARTRRFLALAARNQVGINAMYLNVMTGMCTGEELYRSLYFSKSLQRKYGIPLKFACLTDAPSHTWFVPSLLADAGVEGFANGSNQTRAPLLGHSRLNEESPFWWEGPDGRRVMTWFARSYLQFARLIGGQPSLDRLRRTVPQFLARYRRADYPVDAVLLYGLYTDNAEIRGGEAGILKAWNQEYAFPKIVPATDADYYAYLAGHYRDKLPVFRGDAGAYWEDGAGSTAAETAINRDTQRLLPVDEMAASLASAFHPAEAYPADEFRDAWKNLLFYDEHTWGSSRAIPQPGRQLVTDQWEFKRAYALRAHWAAKDLLYRSLNRLVQNIGIEGQTMFAFNPDLWTRTGIVQIEIEPARELFDLATGKPIPVDVVSEQDNYRVLRFLAKDVPGLGYRAWGVRPVKRQESVTATATPPQNTIESRFYRLVLDPKTGAIEKLVDKELNRDLVDRRAPYRLNQLLYVAGGENSRILHEQVIMKPPRLEISPPTGAHIFEAVRTPFGSRIRVRAEARNVPSIETEINLYDDIKRVEIVNRIRKTETRAKEAVYFAFPFAVSPPELAYQVQNTWIRPNTDQLPGACRDWFATQNVVLARDAGMAIAWATPDAPLVTLTDINRGMWLKRLEVTNGHVYSYVMNNYWFTNYKASQGGDMTFRYAITSAKSLSPSELARFDAETRSPLVGYPFYDTGNVRLEKVARAMPAAVGSFLDVNADNAQVTAFKQAEDGSGYMLRLRETAGQKGFAKLSSKPFRLTAAALCNGVEDNCKPLPVQEGKIEVPLNPHAFTTVRLQLNVAHALMRAASTLMSTQGGALPNPLTGTNPGRTRRSSPPSRETPQ